MKRLLGMSMAAVFWLVPCGAALAQTAITYQGQLQQSGAPFAGTADMEFRLFDAQSGGTQLGLTDTHNGVQVVDGLFQVMLDFEAGFDGPRWLEVEVDGVILNPRQPISPAPVALVAQQAGESLTVHVSQITGLLGQGHSLLFPDIIDNSAEIEISGIGTLDPAIILTGPGMEIERISGFDGQGNPDDQPGVSMDYPLIFEYDGPHNDALQTWHDQWQGGTGTTQSATIIIRDLAGLEQARWNLHLLAPVSIEPGLDGRNRHTLEPQYEPSSNVVIERDPIDFPADISINPDADLRVEISGLHVAYPAVIEHDPVERTVVLVFDYIEAGPIWNWTRLVAGGSDGKRAMSIIEEDTPGVTEIGRTNFFGVFPIEFQQFTGFGQIDKLKERVTLSYDIFEVQE